MPWTRWQKRWGYCWVGLKRNKSSRLINISHWRRSGDRIGIKLGKMEENSEECSQGKAEAGRGGHRHVYRDWASGYHGMAITAGIRFLAPRFGTRPIGVRDDAGDDSGDEWH